MNTKAKITSQVHQDERLILQDNIPLTTPLVVYIEPSGFCNLKCIFCPQSTGGKALKKSLMSLKLFKKLIDDLAEFPNKVKLLRVCGNGEPLTNKDIVKMLQYAKEKNLAERIEFISNGILLTDDLAKTLPRFADRIIISIEGLSSDDYQQTSGLKINFQNLLDKVGLLYKNRGKCTLHIKIHSKAISSEKEKTKFLNMFSNRCNEIYIEKLVPMWPQLDLDYNPNEFRYGGELTKRRVCVQMFKGFQVQADGEVVPCCVDWKRVNVIGDINKNSLFEIWNGKKLRNLQIEHLRGNKNKTEPCKDCTMNDYCDIDNIDESSEKLIQRLKS
ncbi:MAG: radical SAM/SPASM domain-containing protein [Patescibacteria group bacterium]